MSKNTKSIKKPEAQNPTPVAAAQESRPTKKSTTRPGKKVISLIVDERWAARVALCAKAEGISQSQFIFNIVSKGLKGRLDAALEALKADVEG